MDGVGRISGQMLEADLKRLGVELLIRDDLGTTPLLYFDVTNNNLALHQISVNTSSVPRVTVDVIGTVNAESIIANSIVTLGNIEFSNSTISDFNNYITINSADAIQIGNKLTASDLSFYSNRIDSSSSVHFYTDGSGPLDIYANTNVFSNLLEVTGNIIFNGSTITFGLNDNHNIVFDSDVKSNFVPDQNNFYSIGNQDRRWNDVFVTTVNTHQLDVTNFKVDNLYPVTRPGHNLFVSINGSDSNVGNHENGPYRSISYALSQATAGTTIKIYPGTYQESFPLTVPAGVTIFGIDLATVIIEPTLATNHFDAFLLNGENIIQGLSIQNFFYDSINDTGYAFRFANNCLVTSRSPYLKNIKVNTVGSVTSETDPLGFDQGDAGKGALVDGAVVNSLSNQASMLFDDVNFTTPGVDCLTMKNGVRVEWVNCSSNFAARGLYAVNGTAGFASLGTKFGAELRSITSTTNYGTYGAVADGASTLMYLIDHSFFYIGLNGAENNDPTLVHQEDETIKLNSGTIHFTSTDHLGTFRVGDQFSVNSKKGTTSINISDVVSGLNSLTLRDNAGNITVIDATEVVTGNLRLIGNTFESLVGDINLSAYSDQITLTQNVTVDQTFNVNTDTLFKSNLIIGNETTDTVRFNTYFDQSINPNTDEFYDLGKTLVWRKAYLGEMQIDSININGNLISSTTLDTNIILGANGTGFIEFEDIYFKNNVLSTQFSNRSILITADGTGHIKLNKSTYLTGELLSSADIFVHSNTYFGTDSTNSFNFVSTVDSNIIPTLDIHKLGDVNKSWATLFTGNVYSDNIHFFTNNINTYTTDTDLLLIADGTGLVKVEYIGFSNNELGTTVTDLDTQFNPDGIGHVKLLTGTDITGELTVTGDVLVSNNITIGNASSDTVRFIARTNSIIPSDTESYDLGINGTVWRTLYTGKIVNDEIDINNNLIQTNIIDTNLELIATGLGEVKIESIGFKDNEFGSNVTNVDTQINPNGLGIVKILTSTDVTGDLSLTGDMLVRGHVQFGNQSTDPVTFVADVASNILPSQTSYYNLGAPSTNIWKTLYVDDIFVNVLGIEVTSNSIQTFFNSDLSLIANNNGAVHIEQLYFKNNSIISETGNIELNIPTGKQLIIDSTGALKVPVGITSARVGLTQADIRFNTDVNRFEGYGQARTTFGGIFSQDRYTYVTAESVQYANDNVINFVADNISTMRVNPTFLGLNGLELASTTYFNNNQISTVTPNTNLFLTPNGTGKTLIDNLSIKDNILLNEANTALTFSSTGTGYYIIAGTNGIVIPNGDSSTRPLNPDTGDIRYNTELGYLEAFDGVQYNNCAGVGESVTEAFISELSDVFALILG